MKKLSKTTRIMSFVLALTILFASCSSTTIIQSTPSGAKVYIDDEPVGTTPYRYSDTKIVGSKTIIRLEKEGYEPFHTVMTRDEKADVGAIIGGIFFLVPFLWTLEYKPTHTYELTPYYDAENHLIKPMERKANNLNGEGI